METRPEILPCGAVRRRQYNDPGWSCNGTHLVQLTTGPAGVPVVIHEDALPMLMARPEADAYKPQLFAGGDHYHAVLKPPEVQVSER